MARSSVGIGAFGLLLVTSLTTLSIVLPLTVSVNVAVPMAPQGFQMGDPNYQYIKKQCPTSKNWTSQLATDERVLSNTYFAQGNESISDPRGLNTLAIVWGQFVDHDIVLTITDPDTQLTITGNDNKTFNVTRTVKNSITGESKTLITPGMDASTVYGDYENPEKLTFLKEPNSCLLRVSTGNLIYLNESSGKFMAGDERADEHTILTAIHTLWLREHNRLCGEMPPEWTPEQQFWKARQIVIAEFIHITFREWLPALMGSQYNDLVSLTGSLDGMRITDVFAGAAFRFGHSMIPDSIGPFQLLQLFFNPQLLQEHGVGYFLELAANTPAQKCDVKVVDGLRNIMFGQEDLVTRNLFRSRDMGLPTYPEICECYGTTPTSAFEDPLLGLLSEPLVDGSSLPRTIAVVLAEQFNRYYHRIDLGTKYNILVDRLTLDTLIRRNSQIDQDKKVSFFL